MDKSISFQEQYDYPVGKIMDEVLNEDNFILVNCNVPLYWYNDKDNQIYTAGSVFITAAVLGIYEKENEGFLFKLAVLDTSSEDYIPMYSHIAVSDEIIMESSIIDDIPEYEEIYNSYVEYYMTCEELHETAPFAIDGIIYGPLDTVTNSYPVIAKNTWLLEDEQLKNGDEIYNEFDAECWLLENHPDFYTNATIYRVYPGSQHKFPSDELFKTVVFDSLGSTNFRNIVDKRRSYAKIMAMSRGIILGDYELEQFDEFKSVVNKEMYEDLMREEYEQMKESSREVEERWSQREKSMRQREMMMRDRERQMEA